MKPLYDRQKRICLLYDMLKSIGYKVDMKYFRRCTRDTLIAYNVIMLNKIAYLTNKEVVKVYDAVRNSLTRIHKGFKNSPKNGYNTLVERQIESEYLEFLPNLLEHLDGENFVNEPKPTNNPRKKPLEPLEPKADAQGNPQE